jgi:hypothetical protein
VISFRPRRLYSRERAPGTRWMGGSVGPSTALDDVEKRKFLTLPGLELRPLRRPARSQSLYGLRYHMNILGLLGRVQEEGIMKVE